MATNTKNLSPLVQALLHLDNDFEDLERLRTNIEQLDLDSESGLARARHLLGKFSETGTRLGQGLQVFSQTLNETRDRAEKSASFVAARANLIQERQEHSNQMMERFRMLVEKVKTLTAQVSDLNRPASGEGFSDEQKASMPNIITDLDFQLGALVEEMLNLKEDTRSANMKSLEQNADALAQSMNASRRRLRALTGRPDDEEKQLS